MRDKLASRPDLIEKVTPSYPPLAKRIILDNGWFDALLLDTVDLVDDGIERVERDAIITTRGKRVNVDAIVLATGFRVNEFLGR